MQCLSIARIRHSKGSSPEREYRIVSVRAHVERISREWVGAPRRVRTRSRRRRMPRREEVGPTVTLGEGGGGGGDEGEGENGER